MIELVNTSLPNGLLPGTHGFATVAMTRGTPDAIRTLLEGLSSYVHRATAHDARYSTDNPVAWHHVAPPRAGHVLSRVAACDFDYTGRTNRLARHWQVADAEWPADANAARILLSRRASFETPWAGEPRWLPPADVSCLSVPVAVSASSVAPQWVALYGEKGRRWAEKIALELRRGLASAAAKPFIMSTTPAWDPDGTKLLGLFADLIDLLPAHLRGKATFSTHAAVLPGWVPCALRGLLPDDAAFGTLVTGRPWFDAVSGVLHGEELLPVEAPPSEPVDNALPSPAKPTRPRDSSVASSVSTRTGRPLNFSTGMPGKGMQVPPVKTGKSATLAFVVVLLAILAGALAFLLHSLRGGESVESNLTTPESAHLSPAPAEQEKTESIESADKLEESPVSAEGDAETEEETILAESAEEPSSSPEPMPPRLLEGAVLWNSVFKPLPDDGEIVTLWYYPLDSDELVSIEAEIVVGGGVRSWGTPPQYRFVQLWQYPQNRVIWDFENDGEVEVSLEKQAESIDWPLLLFGPDSRIWREWDEETRDDSPHIEFHARASLNTPPYIFEHAWRHDATGHNQVDVASLWNEAWEEAYRQWREEDDRIEERKKSLRNEIAELERTKLEIQEKIQDAPRRVQQLQAQLDALDKKNFEDRQRQIADIERRKAAVAGKTTAEKRKKDDLERQLVQVRNAPLPISPKQQEIQRRIAQENENLERGKRRMSAIDNAIQKKKEELEEQEALQPLVSGSEQERIARSTLEQMGRLTVTLTVEMGMHAEKEE